MNRGVFHILLLVALLLQCSPLCACSVIDLFAGHSPAPVDVQPEGNAVTSAGGIHTCESPAGDEACTGFCSVQKSTESGKACRFAGSAMVPVASVFGPIAVPTASSRAAFPTEAAGPVRDGPSPPRMTPLLI